jgi:hypothetical protein
MAAATAWKAICSRLPGLAAEAHALIDRDRVL